jgi:uncharacterized protein
MADQSNQPPRKLLLKVGGMHCPNCEVLIERRFKKIPGVRKVKARHASGKVYLVHSGELDFGALRGAIADDGYTVGRWQGPNGDPSSASKDSRFGSKSSGPDYVEIGAAFLLLVGLYLVLKQFHITPDSLAIPNTISYGLAFAIGVVASLSTCIAVTGGLLVAVAAKYNAASGNLTSAQRFKPHIYFNVGRIVSYTLLGGAVGALGSTIALSPEANGILVIAASVIMILLGLQMLKLLPSLGALQPRMPKFLAHKIHSLTEGEAKGGAFVLGASTFFLPCGFTQALQLYVLAKGSFETGALVMLAFALGTLPALLSLSALSSFARGTFQKYFLRFAGAAVVLLGLFNIQSGFTLNALSSGAATPTSGQATQTSQPAVNSIPIVDGKQVVNMKLIGYTYQPNQFTVAAGVPVEWRIDGRQAAGCGRFLLAPRAGVRKLLSSSDITVVSFTPQEAGDIGFNCGMGMMTRGSKFIVRANTTATAPAPVQAQAITFSADQRAELGRITKEYLLQHPEVLQEAFAALESRQQAADAEQHSAAVKENAAAIFGSPRQVVLGNPQGDVTLVEFFDYNCGYCRGALGDMVGLLKADPKLKIVLKEFPVLGDASVEAARVAVAVRMQDEGGTKYLEFHQKLLGGRGQADRARALAVAKEVGLDMARLEHDMASPETKATIDENLKLAEALGLNGTPSYVVGTDVVVGAIGIDGLKEKISAARGGPATKL